MFKIVNKLLLGTGIKRLDVEAPTIACSFQPGQFVMVCPEPHAKWTPLTIVEGDSRRGIISLIFQERGSATRLLGSLLIDGHIFSISGPFGQVKKSKQVGTVICAATGVSAAQLLPMCRAYSRSANKVIAVIGAKTKSELILEPQMRIACHKIFLITQDGSYQRRGTVAEVVKELLNSEKVNLVYSIGETAMLREVAAMTARKGISNLIQVHTIMSCGRGICGSCRVKADEQLVLACEEGPEFNGHTMDFDYLQHRVEHVCSHDAQDEDIIKKGKGFFQRLLES